MFYSWRRKRYKQVTSVLTLKSINKWNVSSKRHETDTLPIIGNTKSTAGLQNKTLRSTLLGIRRYTKLWLGVRPEGQIHKEDINQTLFLKLACQRTRQWVRKYLWKHINAGKKASTRACRCQPVTDVLPASAVRPNPCPQPSLGTQFSHPGFKAPQDSTPGATLLAKLGIQEGSSQDTSENTHQKPFLETTLNHYCCLLNIPNTGPQESTRSLLLPFVTCSNTTLPSLIEKASHLQEKKGVLGIGYQWFNFIEAVERVLASCLAHDGKGCLTKSLPPWATRRAHLQAMGSARRIAQQMVMKAGIKCNMPALQKPTFNTGINSNISVLHTTIWRNREANSNVGTNAIPAYMQQFEAILYRSKKYIICHFSLFKATYKIVSCLCKLLLTRISV